MALVEIRGCRTGGPIEQPHEAIVEPGGGILKQEMRLAAAAGYETSWSRVLLVEGTSGVGKSTLIDRLLRRFVALQPPRRLRTLLHLTQAHTYGPRAPLEDLAEGGA